MFDKVFSCQLYLKDYCLSSSQGASFAFVACTVNATVQQVFHKRIRPHLCVFFYVKLTITYEIFITKCVELLQFTLSLENFWFEVYSDVHFYFDFKLRYS